LACAAALALGLAAAPLVAGEGGLSPQAIAALRASFHMDGRARAAYNAVTNNDINQLTLDEDLLRRHNDLFNHRIKTAGVTNQNMSGRCWLFATLNVVRPHILESHKIESFEFSENYLTFWDKLEKANCFLEDALELAGRDPLDRDVQTLYQRESANDGGWWDFAVALVKKYGAVPKEIMPETHSSGNTMALNMLLRRELKVQALRLCRLKKEGKPPAELRREKEKVLANVYRLLVLNLGEPPAEFQWRYELAAHGDAKKSDEKKPAGKKPDEKKTGGKKTARGEAKLSPLRSYTPQSFWKEWAGDIDLDQYVQLVNNPAQEYGKLYRISSARNIQESRDVQYLNVKIEVLKEAAAQSLLDKQPLWFAADVIKDQDRKYGIMAVGLHDYNSLFDLKETLSKAERMSYYDGAPDHAMALMGVDIQHGKPVKWLVENSWGKEHGHDGYWTMYDNWFDEHLYVLVVKRAYVPKAALALLEQAPITLPRWHPMSQASD
jgi:bleomycin hydrolase